MSGILIAASGIARPRVQLSGSAGSPNTDTDFSVGSTATAGWNFLATGDCTKISGSAHNKSEWFGYPWESSHETPDATYYIRLTTEAGTGPDSGMTPGTVYALSSSRFFSITCGPGFQSQTYTGKIEIATDSGMTDIVDTGYYRANVDTEL